MYTWNHRSLTLSELLKGLLHVHPVTMEHQVNAEPDALGSLSIYIYAQLFTVSYSRMALFWRSMLLTVRASCCWEGRRVLPSSRGNSTKQDCAVPNSKTSKTFNDQRETISCSLWLGPAPFPSPLIAFPWTRTWSITVAQILSEMTALVLPPPPPRPLPPRTLPLFSLCPSDCVHPFLISTFGSAMSTRDQLILVPSSATSVNSCERLCVTYGTCAVIVCIFYHH